MFLISHKIILFFTKSAVIQDCCNYISFRLKCFLVGKDPTSTFFIKLWYLWRILWIQFSRSIVVEKLCRVHFRYGVLYTLLHTLQCDYIFVLITRSAKIFSLHQCYQLLGISINMNTKPYGFYICMLLYYYMCNLWCFIN